jgi:hypothetical protein
MGLVYGESGFPVSRRFRSISRLWRSHKFGLLPKRPAFQRGAFQHLHPIRLALYQQ